MSNKTEEQRQRDYILLLIPQAKKELDAAQRTIGHEAIILNRIIEKVEKYFTQTFNQ